MGVLAKHKITGKIAYVSEGTLAHNDSLVKASKEDIQAETRAEFIRVFGYEPDKSERNTEPNSSWTKADLLAYAEGKKLSVDDSFTKAELLEALQEGK